MGIVPELAAPYTTDQLCIQQLSCRLLGGSALLSTCVHRSVAAPAPPGCSSPILDMNARCDSGRVKLQIYLCAFWLMQTQHPTSLRYPTCEVSGAWQGCTAKWYPRETDRAILSNRCELGKGAEVASESPKSSYNPSYSW